MKSEQPDSVMRENPAEENPFDAPQTEVPASRRWLWMKWMLRTVAAVFFVAALPAAARGLELANQEYWRILPVDRIIYDIEVDGEPVTIAGAIKSEAITVVRTWFLSGLLFWLSFRFSSPSPQRPENVRASLD